MTLHGFVTLLIALTALPIIIFVGNYFLRSRWYKYAAGWVLFIFMAIVGEFLVLSLYVRITHHHFSEWFAAFCWGQILIASWWQLGILIKTQRADRAKRRAAKKHLFEDHP